MMGMPSSSSGLAEVAQVLMMLRAEMSQREARMTASFNQQMERVQYETGRARQEIQNLVHGASAQIAQEARDAVAPVAAEYERAVAATSERLRGASKTVWMWFGAAGGILLLTLFAGWLVASYYWRQLDAAKEELSRYQNAIAVTQAFYASDATLCGNRICVNPDPSAQRLGEHRQYQQAKLRPTPK